MFARTEKFSTSMRWKLVWFMTPFQQKEKKEYFGFKSTTKPFAIFEIKMFEMELIRMVSNIEMRPFNNNPQDRMKEDIQRMKEIKEMIVSSDKTSNHYLINLNKYKSLHSQAIQKEYKKIKTVP